MPSFSLERAYAFRERSQTPHHRSDVLPFPMRQCRKRACVHALLLDRVEHAGCGRYDGSVGDVDMPGNHRRAADLAVSTDARAARDPDASGDRSVRADAAIVADLNLVIELDVVL